MAEQGGSAKPAHVMDLIKQFDFLSIGVGGKIHCALTDRDIPLRVDAIQQHLSSKKLKKEREWYKADYTKYEPYIVPLKSNPKQLYCTLTETELNRIPSEVEAHVNGRRFKIRKEMENSKQTTTTPTTSKEGFWAPDKLEDDSDDEMTDAKPSGADEDNMETDEGEVVGKRGQKSRGGLKGPQRDVRMGDTNGENAIGNQRRAAKNSTKKTNRNKGNGAVSGEGDTNGERKAKQPPQQARGKLRKEQKRNGFDARMASKVESGELQNGKAMEGNGLLTEAKKANGVAEADDGKMAKEISAHARKRGKNKKNKKAKAKEAGGAPKEGNHRGASLEALEDRPDTRKGQSSSSKRKPSVVQAKSHGKKLKG